MVGARLRPAQRQATVGLSTAELIFGTGPQRLPWRHRARSGADLSTLHGPWLIHPCTMLLNMRARSSRDLSLRRARCQKRISRPIAFIASVLTAGKNDTKCLPVLLLASRGRNSYPRNVNDVTS